MRVGIEAKVNYQLNKFPVIKKAVKRLYQRSMCALSPRFVSEGNIKRVTPLDSGEYFFGYYDKSPWDSTGRYMLCIRAGRTWKDAAPAEPAEIIQIDTETGNQIRVLGKTHAWNVQQGCMLQWVGPGYDKEIIYNDFQEGHFCCVLLNVRTGEERVIGAPIYSVASDGAFALTLDFSRLHRLRKGYGYSNLEDLTKGSLIPEGACIWKINLCSGNKEPLISWQDLYRFETKKSMEGAEHKVNHIMLNPSGTRFMFLHRWIRHKRKFTRLVTVNSDGTDFYNLSDDDMVSHCCWKNDDTILAFANKYREGNGYFIMHDRTHDYTQIWKGLQNDGHPGYSPDGSRIVVDSYPDRRRIARIMINTEKEISVRARVFAPFRYDNDTRCDLHPRWDREGKKICFDAVFEGKRALYVLETGETGCR